MVEFMEFVGFVVFIEFVEGVSVELIGLFMIIGLGKREGLAMMAMIRELAFINPLHCYFDKSSSSGRRRHI